jgi:hypothetical protein
VSFIIFLSSGVFCLLFLVIFGLAFSCFVFFCLHWFVIVLSVLVSLSVSYVCSLCASVSMSFLVSSLSPFDFEPLARVSVYVCVCVCVCLVLF